MTDGLDDLIEIIERIERDLENNSHYAYFNSANSAFEKGDLDLSEENINEAIERSQGYIDYYAFRAQVKYRKGNLKGAIDDLKYVISNRSELYANRNLPHLLELIEQYKDLLEEEKRRELLDLESRLNDSERRNDELHTENVNLSARLDSANEKIERLKKERWSKLYAGIKNTALSPLRLLGKGLNRIGNYVSGINRAKAAYSIILVAGLSLTGGMIAKGVYSWDPNSLIEVEETDREQTNYVTDETQDNRREECVSEIVDLPNNNGVNDDYNSPGYNAGSSGTDSTNTYQNDSNATGSQANVEVIGEGNSQLDNTIINVTTQNETTTSRRSEERSENTRRPRSSSGGSTSYQQNHDGQLLDQEEVTLEYCETMDLEDCMREARRLALQGNFEEALPIYRSACHNESYSSCMALAYFYQNGLGVEADQQIALQLYRISCNAGINLACNRLNNDGDLIE